MNNFERGLLSFLAAVAPTIETLFIHSNRSIAIFNASDALFAGVVAQQTQQAPAQPPAPPNG